MTRNPGKCLLFLIAPFLTPGLCPAEEPSAPHPVWIGPTPYEKEPPIYWGPDHMGRSPNSDWSSVPGGSGWTHFRAAAIFAVQSNGGNSGSGLLSWNPEFKVFKYLYLGLNAGWAVFEDQASDQKVQSVEYQAVLGLRIFNTPLSLELAAGAQTWVNAEGTYALVGGNLNWLFRKPALFIFDRIFLGYSFFNLTNFPTQEYKLGLGIHF